MVFIKVPVGLLVIISSIFIQTASGTPRHHHGSVEYERKHGRQSSNVFLDKPDRTQRNRDESPLQIPTAYVDVEPDNMVAEKVDRTQRHRDQRPLQSKSKMGLPINIYLRKADRSQKQSDQKTSQSESNTDGESDDVLLVEKAYRKNRHRDQRPLQSASNSKYKPTNKAKITPIKKPASDAKIIAELKKYWVLYQLPARYKKMGKKVPAKELQRALSLNGIESPTNADLVQALKEHWIISEIPKSNDNNRNNQGRSYRKSKPTISNDDILAGLENDWISYQLPIPYLIPKSPRSKQGRTMVNFKLRYSMEKSSNERFYVRQPSNKEVIAELKLQTTIVFGGKMSKQNTQTQVAVEYFSSNYSSNPKAKGRSISTKPIPNKPVEDNKDTEILADPEAAVEHGDENDEVGPSLDSFIGKQFGERKISYKQWNDTLASHGNPANRPVGSPRPGR